MTGRRGISSLESALTLTVVIGLLLVIGSTARAVTARLWFDHCLYEALICVSEGREVPECEREAEAKALRVPLGTRAFKFRLRKVGKQWQGEIHWQGEFQTDARRTLKLRDSL
jgi:hypothetical protein